MVFTYNEFILEKQKMIVPLIISRDLLNIIKKIDNPISTELIKMYYGDYAVDKSYVDILYDRNDMWSFMSADRIYRETGITPEYDKVKFEPNFVSNFYLRDANKLYQSKLRMDINIGKFINSVISDKTISSSQNIEKFITEYKSIHNSIYGTENIKVVKGEEIRYWYLVDNYEDRDERTTLGKSCMKYKHCQDYLDIYVKNRQVSLLIKLNVEGKLSARAILWESDGKKYIDRIYYTREEYKKTLEKWAEKNGYKNISGKITLRLDNTDFDKYPYMDNFILINRYNNTIYNGEDVSEPEYWIRCQNIDGTFEELNTGMVWSDRDSCYYNEEDAVWIRSIDSFVHKNEAVYVDHIGQYYLIDDCVYSNYSNQWYLNSEVCYSKYLDDHLYRDDCIPVYMDVHKGEWDYLPSDMELELFMFYEDEAYFINLWFKENSKWIFFGQKLKVSEVDGVLKIDSGGNLEMTGGEYFNKKYSTGKSYYLIYEELKYYYIKKSDEIIEKIKNENYLTYVFYENLEKVLNDRDLNPKGYDMDYVISAIRENIKRSFELNRNDLRIRLSKIDFPSKLDGACTSILRYISEMINVDKYIYAYNLSRYGKLVKVSLGEIIEKHK